MSEAPRPDQNPPKRTKTSKMDIYSKVIIPTVALFIAWQVFGVQAQNAANNDQDIKQRLNNMQEFQRQLEAQTQTIDLQQRAMADVQKSIIAQNDNSLKHLILSKNSAEAMHDRWVGLVSRQLEDVIRINVSIAMLGGTVGILNEKNVASNKDGNELLQTVVDSARVSSEIAALHHHLIIEHFISNKLLLIESDQVLKATPPEKQTDVANSYAKKIQQHQIDFQASVESQMAPLLKRSQEIRTKEKEIINRFKSELEKKSKDK